MKPVVVAAALCLAIAGCVRDAKPAGQSPSPSPTSPTLPNATGSAVASRTDLKDGKHYVYAKSLDTAKRTTVVDVVQFLTAEEAGSATKDTPITLATLKSFFVDGSAQHALFILTLEDGLVTDIREQYLP